MTEDAAHVLEWIYESYMTDDGNHERIEDYKGTLALSLEIGRMYHCFTSDDGIRAFVDIPPEGMLCALIEYESKWMRRSEREAEERDKQSPEEIMELMDELGGLRWDRIGDRVVIY